MSSPDAPGLRRRRRRSRRAADDPSSIDEPPTSQPDQDETATGRRSGPSMPAGRQSGSVAGSTKPANGGKPGTAKTGTAKTGTAKTGTAKTARRQPSEPGARAGRESERGWRDLAGSGSSQLGVSGALRARDVARPGPAELAEAERSVQLVRRQWQPPATD